MVRFFLPCMLAMLTGCASTGGIVPGESIELAVGRRASLPDGSSLRYAGIANDSRCPPQVQCIRAGDADVLFEYSAPAEAGPAHITLNTERTTSMQLGRWRLHLLSLQAGETPPVTIRIDDAKEAAP